MRKAIILHGMPSKEEYDGDEAGHHWIPWLKNQLEQQGYRVAAPELPNPYAPVYEDWKATFEQFPLDEETVLVGHSCGAGFLVRYLSENPVQVGKVVLVAPYLDADKDHIPEFFDFQIKQNLVQQTGGITIMISEDDDIDILESVRIILTACEGINVKEFTNKGHFTFEDMHTEEFPELLQIIT